MRGGSDPDNVREEVLGLVLGTVGAVAAVVDAAAKHSHKSGVGWCRTKETAPARCLPQSAP